MVLHNLRINQDLNSEECKLLLYQFKQSWHKESDRSSRIRHSKCLYLTLQSGSTAKLPIFQSFYDTNILIDLITTKHRYFTRQLRWSIIFYTIFLSLIQIISLLSITDSEISVPNNQSVIIFALARIWISMVNLIFSKNLTSLQVSSINTQIIGRVILNSNKC